MSTEITNSREFLKETIQLKVDTEAAFLLLAERLHRIYNENLWKGEYGDFGEFLLDARLSKPTASKLIIVYEVFVLKHRLPQKKLAEIGWSSLYTIASRSDTKERAIELVERAGLLTRNDLELSIKQEEHPKCKHDWESMNYRQCKNCLVRERVYEG